MSKAYVLLSGGMDSAVCLQLARIKYRTVTAISVNYKQRHNKRELHAAKIIAGYWGDVRHQIVDLPIIGEGGLTDVSLEIPAVSYDELPEGQSPTFVPYRNGLLLSLLTSLAVADPEAEAVYFGAHAEDAENWAYPDCTPEFIGAQAAAIHIGTYHRIRLHAPLQDLQKMDVVKTGLELGVPFYHTWSCYEGRVIHCGVCPTCRSRKNAFINAGHRDPTEYEV